MPSKGAESAGERPISVRIRRAVQLTGLSRTKIYQLIKSGEIEIIKIGSVTLIPFEALERLIQSRR
jgi:excisionase family DNA binding protein